jgi:endoglucanase
MTLFAALLSCSIQREPLDQTRLALTEQVLKESWEVYVNRFIQADGRVIDRQANDITTSEGQAYAMLRAVWMKDRGVFDKTYSWAVNNLNSGVREDRLWAWKWGKTTNGDWRVLDPAFASDADEDAVLALMLAWKTWNDASYWEHAQQTLADLWAIGTVRVAGRRFLLAGDSLCQGRSCRINPSYAAPYAYRIFAKFDTEHAWNDLVESSYFLLNQASLLTSTRLPPDWLNLDLDTGGLTLGKDEESSFSYDAFRVYWRVALDRDLFNDPQASRYLAASLPWIVRQWDAERKLPAIVSAQGQPRAQYESLEMLAGLIAALRDVNPEVAGSMYARIASGYSNGAWGDRESYYLQNWAWFGRALYEGYLAPFDALK